MNYKIKYIILLIVLLQNILYVNSSRQIQLILKYDDAINLSTTKFESPRCESQTKIQQALSQIDEWVQITQSADSLKQYKKSLVDLVDMIEESRFYVREQQNEEKLEYEVNMSQSVSEIQIQNNNIDLTLDVLTERLSRIENIQTYLETLREEGFRDYEDYDKVLGSLNSFIQDIDNLESMEDQLSMNRFRLIEKADEMQQIYNKCYGEMNLKIIKQESQEQDIFKLPQSEQILHKTSKDAKKEIERNDNIEDILDSSLLDSNKNEFDLLDSKANYIQDSNLNDIEDTQIKKSIQDPEDNLEQQLDSNIEDIPLNSNINEILDSTANILDTEIDIDDSSINNQDSNADNKTDDLKDQLNEMKETNLISHERLTPELNILSLEDKIERENDENSTNLKEIIDSDFIENSILNRMVNKSEEEFIKNDSKESYKSNKIMIENVIKQSSSKSNEQRTHDNKEFERSDGIFLETTFKKPQRHRLTKQKFGKN